MSDGIIIALIAGSVALCVAYLNSFLAESFRRFRDGSTLAASLAGELAAYELAWPMIINMMDGIVKDIDSGRRNTKFLRPFEKPRDRVFEDVVGKLGLLGVSLAENIVFVYGNIAAFRVALEIIARDEKDMTDDELRARCIACKDVVLRAVDRGTDLVVTLRDRAHQPFVPEWPWSAWLAFLGHHIV